MRSLILLAALAITAGLSACDSAPTADPGNTVETGNSNSVDHERPCPPPKSRDGVQPACD